MMKKGLFLFTFTVSVSFCIANNTTGIPECVANDDCASDRVCAKQACVDPCDGVCGPHTVCHVTNHVAMCSCSPGHSGHPIIGCSASADVHRHPGCAGHDQCPTSQACIQGQCGDPCEGLCGDNTSCTVHLHVPACACKDGHTGNPFLGCSPQADFPRSPSCIGNEQCPTSQVCIQGQCDDPCEGLCGDNTSCIVHLHIAYCTCKDDYTGSPFLGCSPQVISGVWPPTSMGKKRFYVENANKANWHEALMSCLRNNSRLASIDNMEEFEDVKQVIRQTGRRLSSYWTSGSDVGYEGHYFWATTGKPVSLSSAMWVEDEPKDTAGTDNCLDMWENNVNKGYALNDVECDFKTYYVCEYYN